MNPNEFLARCAKAVGAAPQAFSTVESLNGFFQLLRPDGRLLDRIVFGTPAADAVRSRMASIYDATAPSWNRSDGYFTIRAPEMLTEAKAIEIASEHFERCARLAEAIKHDWLLSFLSPAPNLYIAAADVVGSGMPTDFPDALCDAANTFIDSLKAADTDILTLRDAIYYMTCDIIVTEYVLWPCYQESSEIREPFEPGFDLWKHGCSVTFTDEHTAVLCGPIRT